MLDGIQRGNRGVMVVRDGSLRGGDSFFYAYGTYSSANGKWKGEVTNQKHTPTFGARAAATLWRTGGDRRLQAGNSGASGNAEGTLQGRDAYGARLAPWRRLCI
jgi:hypothetical protein